MQLSSKMYNVQMYNVQMYKAQLYNVQEGHLRNGDHLLQVGDVRLWGMGAQQVGSRAVNHLREVLQCPEKAPTRSFSLQPMLKF